jgi:hypothetical protein
MQGDPPQWMSDPDVGVMAILTGVGGSQEDPTYQISFLNTESGDHFDITIATAQAMFWLNPHTYGLLSTDGSTLVSIDLIQGEVVVAPFDWGSFRLLKGSHLAAYPEHLFGPNTPLVGFLTPDDGGVVTFVAETKTYSSDLSMIAQCNEETRVLQLDRSEVIWSSDFEDGWEDYECAWSPLEPQILAIPQGTWGRVAFEFKRILIVDVLEGETVATLPFDKSMISFESGRISWSPDGRYLLYRSSHQERVGNEYSRAPCVLDLKTGRDFCLTDITDAHYPQGEPILGALMDFRWDQEGGAFYYRFQGGDYSIRDESIPVSGLYRYDISNKAISSLIPEGISELEGRSIHEYNLSPDGEYVYLRHSPWDEKRPDLGHGVLNLESGRFFYLPFPQGGYERMPKPLWRPAGALMGENQ